MLPVQQVWTYHVVGEFSELKILSIRIDVEHDMRFIYNLFRIPKIVILIRLPASVAF
jgi:hypothetical protein